MQSCSALAASAQTESCISPLPVDAQHASMAVNCAAQGVVGLAVETPRPSAEKSEEIPEAMRRIKHTFLWSDSNLREFCHGIR